MLLGTATHHQFPAMDVPDNTAVVKLAGLASNSSYWLISFGLVYAP